MAAPPRHVAIAAKFAAFPAPRGGRGAGAKRSQKRNTKVNEAINESLDGRELTPGRLARKQMLSAETCEALATMRFWIRALLLVTVTACAHASPHPANVDENAKTAS